MGDPNGQLQVTFSASSEVLNFGDDIQFLLGAVREAMDG